MNTVKYVLLGSLAFSLSAKANPRVIIGGIEKVSFAGTTLSAKIDTGADHSSLHATNPEIYSKNGHRWVRFTVEGTDGKKTNLDTKIVRFTRIKQTNSRVKEKRIVIQLEICLGAVRQSAQVNLVDRSKHTHPMLIGRSFLKDKFLVDASQQYRMTLQCG